MKVLYYNDSDHHLFLSLQRSTQIMQPTSLPKIRGGGHVRQEHSAENTSSAALLHLVHTTYDVNSV